MTFAFDTQITEVDATDQRSGDSPAAMKAALEWAQEDGIDFFEFDWFYPPPIRS